ncbi:DNA recombination protein RmuC [Leucobacter viscericola]|uniref:DNA recombination protein RmuC n=1 Tax=Leucobacter viscericola TaxID=2714935 RepID=A0A6G7XEC4_9MICO|nr:DNA recombination protein RmuC [Leucobacter viscericola]QIK62799.1 DNA recombination protein RmuC [Leucobacter viscericola]
MDALLLTLLILNLLGILAALAVLLFRRGPANNGAAGVGGGELRQDLATQRGELAATMATMQQQLSTSLTGLSDRFHTTSQASLQSQVDLKAAIEARFEELRIANEAKLEQVRTTVDEKLQGTLKTALAENAQRVQTLTDTHVAKQTELQETLRTELEKLRQGNEAKLEKMRETVDEKLQGTLERRLGESFKLVSDRLEQVQKGLGEMQTLASDVGGLKRVLTNVKSRGSWGEVQLERQLEDILTPEQYEQNAVIRPGSAERVEFAVKLPGRGETERVLLPIDSKFPQEDYERLLEAQESGEKEAVEAAVKVLERVILTQAKLIAEKYIAPPHSTDFAIMYLPTEGLFAEVVRRPGLASKLQNELRVIVTGPTTLGSLLNSLQMGFRTLAIEKRSSEVWQVLSAAKQEFQKYGQVWEKLEKQLATAQNTVHQAGVRTRAVAKQLRSVETLGTEALAIGQSPIEDIFTEFDEVDEEGPVKESPAEQD